MTIDEWLEHNGSLFTPSMFTWIKAKNLDRVIISDLIGEFQDEMRAKGKQYANFAMAFQTYLRKGYLSKPLSACVRKQQTHIETRGNTL